MRHVLPATGVSIRDGWECPPDGKIQLAFAFRTHSLLKNNILDLCESCTTSHTRFSLSAINVSLVASALQIRSPSNEPIPFTTGPCGNFTPANCIEIIPQVYATRALTSIVTLDFILSGLSLQHFLHSFYCRRILSLWIPSTRSRYPAVLAHLPMAELPKMS